MKTNIKCPHCNSRNLDLDHIFPTCKDCYHFLPKDITKKSARAYKAMEEAQEMFKLTYGEK